MVKVTSVLRDVSKKKKKERSLFCFLSGEKLLVKLVNDLIDPP